jgi:hypothetical protein
MYFFPQLQGKALIQPDQNQSYRVRKEGWDYYAKTGERALWTNSQFSGMPTFQSGGLENKNIYQYLGKASHFFMKKPIGIFLFGCIAMYILLSILGVGPWLSFFGALGFTFSTNLIILFAVGHNSKLDVIMTFPLILAGAYALFDKRYRLGTLLMILGIGLNIYRNHYQMSLYIAIFMGVFYLIEVIKLVKEKDFDHLKKVALWTIVPLILAIGPSTTRIITTLDYLPESIRGDKLVSYNESSNEEYAEKGLRWEYATRFSFDLVDLGSLIVPRFAGGGGKERIEKGGPLDQAIRRSNFQPKNSLAPTYYGRQPFTEGPPYMGILVFMLFLFGVLVLPAKWKIWALFCAGFSVIWALGRTLGGFHEFLFDVIPLFNKFRAPSSVLAASAIVFPLIGMLGLHKVVTSKDKKAFVRPLMISAGSLVAFLLFFLVAGSSLIDMTHVSDQRFPNAGVPMDLVMDQRLDFFRSDLIRGLVLVLLGAGAMWMYLTNRLKELVFVGVIGALAIGDLLTVDIRYLRHDRFVKKQEEVGKFGPRQVDLEILKDTDLHYRVFDVSVNPFRDSYTSYFHSSIGGYNAAKLRRYQDLINFHLKDGSNRVLSMLNTRYYIKKRQDGSQFVERNPNALGNAWFVDDFQVVRDNQSEITRLSTFDPGRTAVVHQEFAQSVAGLDPTPAGEVKLTRYEPNLMVYEYDTDRENFLVFSEIWYGPHKGWQAYIDNQPVDHIRVNYALRGMRVPAGKHTIRFEFDPASYRNGELISLAFSVVVLGALFYILFQLLRSGQQMAVAGAGQEPARKKSVPKKNSSARRKKKS